MGKETIMGRMRLRQIVSMLMVWVAMTGFGAVSVHAAAAQIYVGKDTFDFGTALEGDEVLHDFVVNNKGSGTLEIQKVKTG